MLMKKLIIKRPKEYFNRLCSYKVTVNDTPITELAYGEQKELELTGENGYLQVKMNWCGSEKKSFNELSNNTVLEVESNKFIHRALPSTGALFLLSIIISSIEMAYAKELATGFAIAIILALIGTLTIWRNKWLNLSISSVEPSTRKKLNRHN